MSENELDIGDVQGLEQEMEEWPGGSNGCGRAPRVLRRAEPIGARDVEIKMPPTMAGSAPHVYETASSPTAHISALGHSRRWTLSVTEVKQT